MLFVRLATLLFPLLLAASAASLSFATYLGGPGAEVAMAVSIDAAGNVVVAGSAGLSGGFVTRVDPTGAHILNTFATGGPIMAAALDSAGNMVVAGNNFITKVAPGGQILFTSKVAASVTALAVDAQGSIYATGSAGAGFQTTAGAFQSANAGGTDAFALKLSADGSKVLYATYLGGSGAEAGRAIAVDSSGAAYLVGDTESSDFPLTPGAAQSKLKGVISVLGYGSFGDAFVAKLDAAGAKLTYSTYYGGSAPDIAYGIAVDGAGNAYVTGATSSADFPATAGAFQAKYAGPSADPAAPDAAGDAFVAKFGPLGGVVWSTYLGGTASDAASAIALDAAGNVYITGVTESADFPRAGSFVPTCRTTGGPFLAELDPLGATLLHSTGLSGMGYDSANAIALDSSGGVYLAGETESQVFFATPGAAQTAYGGGASDAFAAKIAFTPQPGPFVACVLNAASLLPGNESFFPLGTVAPGEIVSIFGGGLGPNPALGPQLTAAGNVATALGPISVTFDGIPAPLLYAGPTQINAVAPYGINPNATQMSVGATAGGSITLPVAAAVPAIFAYNGTGQGEAAVFNQDGTVNSIANPAPRGSEIVFYATGFGLMMPPASDGAVSPLFAPFAQPILPVSATIRGVNAPVLYAGAAPGSVAGLIQVNVQTPTSIDFGNEVPLSLMVGGFSSQLQISIAVK